MDNTTVNERFGKRWINIPLKQDLGEDRIQVNKIKSFCSDDVSNVFMNNENEITVYFYKDRGCPLEKLSFTPEFPEETYAKLTGMKLEDLEENE